ncbi:unnamed protein product [Cochlearia groenlandica]
MNNADYTIIIIFMIMIIYITSCCCLNCILRPKTNQETHDEQQDIETGPKTNVLMFKDIKEEEEESNCGERYCPICLEEYEDDHEVRVLEKCEHVFHSFCIDSWLTRNRSCPSCRCVVDLV